MTDGEIIDLFWERSQKGIEEIASQYGKLLYKVAFQIVNNNEDTYECVNDTYMGLWDTIPPQRPNPLCAYACRICKNIALNKLRSKKAIKRGSDLTVSLDELKDVVFQNTDNSVEKFIEAKELGQEINKFLATLDKEQRVIFVKRYYLHESVGDIAKELQIREGTISTKLNRIRKKLEKHLRKQGFWNV